MNRKIVVLAAVGALALPLAACSSGGGGSADTSATGGGSAAAGDRGPITYAQGKDTTGKLQGILDKWNADHPDEKVELIELPEKADDQRTALVQDMQAKAGKYDVAGLDVVWTAEFAARGWLEPLTGLDTSGLLPSTLATGTYDGTLYAAPFNTNAAFLYYRTDLLDKAPTTWEELQADCDIAKQNDMDCYAGQFAQYEGLTVNFSEAVNSAGGTIMDADGNPDMTAPEVKAGLEFLVNGFKDGMIPKEAITYQEEESRRAFQSGKLLFLRNWPYVYNLAETAGSDSVVQGKFDIAPIPGPDGLGASTLGGYNMAISVASKHKATAQDFIAYMTSEDVQKQVLVDMGLPPTFQALYDDADLQSQIPYLATLKDALLQAKPRPQAVNYSEISTEISTDVYKALQGDVSVDDTLATMQTNLQKIVDESK